MDNILEIQGLTRRFDGFCLDNVNLSVAPGTITGLVGANGAGKSTTIKLILNLIRRDAGSIRLFGLDNIEQETAVKKRIGVVFDEPCFHDVLAPRQIGRYMKGLYADWDDQAFAGYLRDFSLPENKIVKEFSRGMKMKLAIAAALSLHPKLLILDEATSGLDPVVRSEILDLFLEFIEDENHSILLSSHITSDLEKVADYIVFIHNRQIVFQMEKDTLLERFAACKCGKGELSRFEQAHILGHRESRFDLEFLVDNAPLVRKAYPELLTEPASIDDIMTFFVKGSNETV